MLTKKNVILFVFLLLAIAYLFWILFKTMQKQFCKSNVNEHFTEYESRMNVMKVFDSVLNRKPTQEEIDKYFMIENEQDMLIAVMEDNNIQKKDVDEEFLNTTEESTMVPESVKNTTPINIPPSEESIQPVSLTNVANAAKNDAAKVQLANNKRDTEIDDKLKDIISTVSDIRILLSLKKTN